MKKVVLLFLLATTGIAASQSVQFAKPKTTATSATFVGSCPTGAVTWAGPEAYAGFDGLSFSNSQCGSFTHVEYPFPGRGIPNTSAGTLRNLHVAVQGVPQFSSAGGTVRIFVNGSPTEISCNIASDGHLNALGDTICSDTTHRFSVKPGDSLSVSLSIQTGDSLWPTIRVAFDRQ